MTVSGRRSHGYRYIVSWGGAGVITLLAAALSGCTNGGATDDEAASGPLSASVGKGTYSLYAAPSSPWSGTFGFVLCTRTGETAVIDDVSWSASLEPISVEVFVRSVDRTQVSRSQRAKYLPVASTWGSPPNWSEFYGPSDISGDVVPFEPGLTVARECDGPAAAAKQFTELMFVLQAGDRGARLSSASVHYTSDGQSFTLPIEVGMVACGSAPSLRRLCSGDPSFDSAADS